MNRENLQFLQESIRYLGFGERLLLNQQLEEQIAKEAKDIQLETEAFFYDKTRLEAILHFRRSDQMDMYFFNKYEARLFHPDEPDRDRNQVFYISKGSGVTLREAFNLLQGRAVNKELTNAEGEKYNAWIQLNFEEKDLHGNYKVKQFRVQYGYDLEKILEKYPIRELKNEVLKASLMKSLRKGNQHTVSFDKSNKTEKMLIEANPRYKTINIYPLNNRRSGQASPGTEPANAETDLPKPGRDDQPEGEEMEDREEIKEEELVLPESKPRARKKSYK